MVAGDGIYWRCSTICVCFRLVIRKFGICAVVGQIAAYRNEVNLFNAYKIFHSPFIVFFTRLLWQMYISQYAY